MKILASDLFWVLVGMLIGGAIAVPVHVLMK